MPLTPRPSQSARWLLLFFGSLVPLLLAGLGLFGLGDLEEAARANVEREAGQRARSLQGQWRAALAVEDAPAEPVQELELPAEPLRFEVGAELEDPDSEVARLQLAAAVAHLHAGDVQASEAAYFRAVASPTEFEGAAFLRMMRAWAGRAESNPTVTGAQVAEAFRTLGEGVGDEASVERTSARLLGLLAAARHLPADFAAEETARFGQALREGLAPLPPAVDGARIEQGAWVLDGDPFWGALERMVSDRLGAAGVDAQALFQRELRLARAVSELYPKAVEDAPPGRWTLVPGDREGERFVGIRKLEDGSTRLALIARSAVEERIRSLAPESDGFQAVVAAGAAPPTTSLTAALPLSGFRGDNPPRLSLSHRDLDAAVRPFTRRLKVLRAGLVGVALLLAGASLMGWVALSRDARLRALRSTFVASVSHDLRTPVASIGLLAHNMGAGFHKGSEELYVKSLQGETARLGRLIDDLLDFGRIERGLPPRIQRGPVALGSWLNAFSQTERERCHLRGSSFDLMTESLPKSAQLDVAALERALSNLVDNALKHGGAKSITLRAKGSKDELLFEVIDGGAGLSKAALRADLFKPFERGDLSGDSTGTGLGLSIVAAIAEAHGGRASLKAGSDGKGAVAALSIPLSHPGAA